MNQRFGDRPVEPEMPISRVVVDGIPRTHLREEGIHHDQFLHFCGKLGGIRIGDHQADVVPHDLCFLDAE